MNKKKVLFGAAYMKMGGVEKSLLALIGILPPEEFEIHLALMIPGGSLEAMLPKHVIVHHIAAYGDSLPFLNHPLKETWRRLRAGDKDAAGDFAGYVRAKASGTLLPLYRHLLRNERELKGIHFDLAVNYGGPSEMLDYLITRHVDAERRALWIHFDLNHVFDRKKTSRLTNGDYDKIYCVSANALNVYRKRYPQFSAKTDIFPNILNAEEVLKKAEEPGIFTPIPGAVNLVTVGRLEILKGQDIALHALALLPPHFHWHFIGGDGGSEAELKEMARKLDVDRRAHFHGVALNPFPYMKGADVYVQPSRSEGAPIALSEAQLFEAPIVATPFTVASQILKNDPRAVIADNMTPTALAKAVGRGVTMAKAGSGTHVMTTREHSPLNAFKELFK